MSLFHQIAQLVTVAGLQEPLGDPLHSHEPLPFRGDDSGIRLVVDSESEGLLGWVDAEEIVGDESAGEVYTPIGLGEFVSGDVTALEAVDLLPAADDGVLFVVQKNRITGTLRYKDLFKPVFALCLLALSLELEQEALKVLSRLPTKSWDCLPATRRDKARQTHHERVGSRNPYVADLLKCTMFCDKATMLRKRGLPPGISKEKVKSTFSTAENVRNKYAHPGEVPEVLAREELASFLRDVDETLQALRDCLAAEEKAAAQDFIATIQSLSVRRTT